MKHLDASWKYTTKVGIGPGELLVREYLYRQGASEFQEKLIDVLTKKLEGEYGADEIIGIVKSLKP